MAIRPDDDIKQMRQQTENAKKELHALLERQDKLAREAQAQADAQKKQARNDKNQQEAHEKWHGREGGDPRNSVYGRAHEMSKEAGGRGYENFTSAMSQIVELSLLINAAVAADLRTGDRLHDLAEKVGGPAIGLAMTAIKAPFKLAFYPKTTANEILDMVNDFTRKWRHGVVLPDSVIATSHCDKGILSFDSLAKELPPGTPGELIQQMETLNHRLITEFLASKGYTADASNVYKNQAGSPLSSTQFEGLKADPKTGLQAFANKQHAIELSDKAPISMQKVESAAAEEPEQQRRPWFR